MQHTTPQLAEQVPVPAGPLAMRLLAQGVPLSLLLDLACPQGPDSPGILASEGSPAEPWWGRPAS